MCKLKTAFEAINIYQTQYNQVDKIWGYFSVVTLAVCGFAIGGNLPSGGLIATIAIIFAYLVFCVGNHQALIAGQKQLEQFATIAKTCASNAELEVSSIDPIPYKQIRLFHLSVIMVVCAGLFIVGLLGVSV